MSTLTVYETVLYSALLRLPREMSHEAKKYRTLETMNELGILGIKDMRIGESGALQYFDHVPRVSIFLFRKAFDIRWGEAASFNCL